MKAAPEVLEHRPRPDPKSGSSREGLDMESIPKHWHENAEIIGLPAHRVPMVASKIDAGVCWLWTASRKANGYGQYNDDQRNWNAHRLVYSLDRGPIPQGMELDHLCRVRHCVNPAHLEVVTRAENTRRHFAAVTHCPQGHAYDEANTYTWGGNRGCRKCRITRASERRRRLRTA